MRDLFVRWKNVVTGEPMNVKTIFYLVSEEARSHIADFMIRAGIYMFQDLCSKILQFRKKNWRTLYGSTLFKEVIV